MKPNQAPSDSRMPAQPTGRSGSTKPSHLDVRTTEIKRDSAGEIPQTLLMTSRLRSVVYIAFALTIEGIAVLAQPTNPAVPVYLFSTFKEGEQDGLRFAFS